MHGGMGRVEGIESGESGRSLAGGEDRERAIFIEKISPTRPSKRCLSDQNRRRATDNILQNRCFD